MQNVVTQDRPPHEQFVELGMAREWWPRAYSIAADALGVEPIYASTAILDRNLVLFLWGPSFGFEGDEAELAKIARIAGPLSDAELAKLIAERAEVH